MKAAATKLFITFILLSNSLVFADTSQLSGGTEVKPIEFEKPELKQMFTEIPSTTVGAFHDAFQPTKKNYYIWGSVIASSVIFYIYDEKLYSFAKRVGRAVGLGNYDHTKSYIGIGGKNILQGPSDIGSTLYYVGNGWVQFAFAAGFYSTGLATKDNRAMSTGVQILTSLFSASIPTQLLKRATGREDPNRATKYRGLWRPFDKDYDKDISGHDAVPSGHLMAAMSTFTVIDANYPEYRHIIRPVGITALSLLSFQMVNIGVHWVSDFPLALAIGYFYGKAASRTGRITKTGSDKTSRWNWKINPVFRAGSRSRVYGIASSVSF